VIDSRRSSRCSKKEGYPNDGEPGCLVIGAGQNGLACACYPARAELRVLVLEAYEKLGGMTPTQEVGINQPRLQQLYAWSAAELGAPGLLELVREGSPIHAWPFAERAVWAPVHPPHTVRAMRRILPVR
jgi:hypothetical protein